MLWALLRQYARPYRWLLASVALLQLISTLASLYLPTVNASIIDDGVAKGDLPIIVELGGVMLAVTALQVLCAIGAVISMVQVSCTSSWICWTSFVVLVSSDAAPNRAASSAENPVTW